MDEIALLQKLFLSWVIGIWAAVIIGMSAIPVLAEDVSVKLSYENDASEASLTGLRKIEDGSVGKLEEAECFFLSALQEAKEGFGEKDPHIASAYNNLNVHEMNLYNQDIGMFEMPCCEESVQENLSQKPYPVITPFSLRKGELISWEYKIQAELYRVKKAFDKAEPLYLEAINILEESFGLDDIRVGAALHNLGQFYLVQRKLEEARNCYQISFTYVKVKARSGVCDSSIMEINVLYLQGKEKDSEALIQDSIWILEQGGLGESMICIRRLRYLAQIYVKSNRPADAENVQRKILRMMELSKGWNSLDTVIAAEGLALTLQSVGSLREAQELLERCLDARETLLPKDHIQIAANMLHIARVEMLISSQQRKTNIARAIVHLDKSKDLLDNAIRIAQQVLDKMTQQKGNQQSIGVSREMRKAGYTALVILGSFFGSCSGPNQALKHQIVCTKMQLFKDSKHFLHDRIAQQVLDKMTQQKGNQQSIGVSREMRKAGHTALVILHFLHDRIAQQVLDKMTQQKGNQQSIGVSREMRKAGHTALVILLQSLNALGQLEISKAELQDSKKSSGHPFEMEEIDFYSVKSSGHPFEMEEIDFYSVEKNTPVLDPEEAFHQCILAFKEFASERSLSDSPEVKFEYLSCLKHLSSLMSTKGMDQGRSGTLQMLKDEIKRVELELSPDKMRKN
ncbi:unnamed protein product [Ilex paraguariensis]|uniref:Uncharacterized protein n=1 Tax=Ilex paraguariensis TaxID=185542 RepID=A0ABC8TA94_9AQUA